MSTPGKTQFQPPHVVVDLPGRDRLEGFPGEKGWTIRVIGCAELSDRVEALLARQRDPARWELPAGTSHVDLLLREFILRAQGNWSYPYPHLELCHCRSVPTETVDQAILAGAHDPARVSAQTSASTACGTCRFDVMKILNYRLGRTG